MPLPKKKKHLSITDPTLKPVLTVSDSDPEGEMGTPHNDDKPVQVLRPQSTEIKKTYQPGISTILDQPSEPDSIEESWTKKRPTSTYLNIIPGLITLFLLAIGAWLLLSNIFYHAPTHSEGTDDASPASSSAVSPSPTATPDPLRAEVIRKETKEEAAKTKETQRNMQACASGYLQATSIESKLPFCRYPERIKPLMEDYYQTHPITPLTFTQFKHIAPMAINHYSFVYCSAKTLEMTSRQFLMEQLPDGTFRVDWESDVCYQPMPWDDFLSKKPTRPIQMRVYATTDHFYAFEFSDESMYQCYKLTTKDSDRHIFGFVKKGTKFAEDLKELTAAKYQSADPPEVALTLNLRFSENSKASQCVVIDSMLAPRWLFVTPPSSIKSTKDTSP